MTALDAMSSSIMGDMQTCGEYNMYTSHGSLARLRRGSKTMELVSALTDEIGYFLVRDCM